jgi:hypothetical protein
MPSRIAPAPSGSACTLIPGCIPKELVPFFASNFFCQQLDVKSFARLFREPYIVPEVSRLALDSVAGTATIFLCMRAPCFFAFCCFLDGMKLA